jgi:cell division protein FtsB
MLGDREMLEEQGRMRYKSISKRGEDWFGLKLDSSR